jgi:hypothetical protein
MKKNGVLAEGLGKIVRGMKLDAHPVISEGTAIQAALKAVPATTYYWEDARMENRLKERRGDPQASYYPEPELVITKVYPDSDPAPENFRLMYKVAIAALQPRASMTVYVDATTGEVVRKRSNETACSPGSANTTFNGTHTIYTVDDG